MTTPNDQLEHAAERTAEAADRGGDVAGGIDAAGARLHVDRDAAARAHRRGARAYTAGQDVYFGQGAYAPETPAGRHLIAHELAHVSQARRGQAAPGLVMRQVVADRLEYDNLAERIQEAISGPGTDEEAVYLALQQLERDPTAIGRLEARYLQRYGVTLQADILDDFSGEELEYALQLLGRGSGGSAQAIGAAPTNSSDIQAAARRLRAAMDIIGTDEEAIYAVLRPFDRNLRLLEDLRIAYHALTGDELRDRIVSEMSGTELDYALYLLGGAPIRADPEITEMTPAQVNRVFAELSRLTFWTTSFEQAPVPFHFPIDGCYARAQMMADRLTELGFASEKVFSISRMPGTMRPNLRVESPFAEDVAAPAVPTVTWWYHVAPIVHVRESNGTVREVVLDPALDSQPLDLSEWLRRMGNLSASRISADEARARATLTNGQYAPGDQFVFTFDRNAFWPGDPRGDTTPQTAQAALESQRGTMTGYALNAEVHEIAGAIRAAVGGPGVDVPAIIAAIRAAPRRARQLVIPRFPHLFGELRPRVAPADWTAIINEVIAP